MNAVENKDHLFTRIILYQLLLSYLAIIIIRNKANSRRQPAADLVHCCSKPTSQMRNDQHGLSNS